MCPVGWVVVNVVGTLVQCYQGVEAGGRGAGLKEEDRELVVV